ncbi:MAG: OmpA family protein [Candidatus Omnitrophota bacterium]|nr:OmpA family protein [Candidatus Omnitrophota bacterium]
MRKVTFTLLLVSSLILISGCSVIFQSGRRSDIERIQSLEKELEALRNTRGLLEESLAKEIQDKQISLAMQEKGLVITVVSEVLFDSGKAKLKPESLPTLDKVAKILVENVPENNINIEGHTDNEPIKHSKWRSNWELSAQRALSVLEYLESKGVDAERLSASGYGQYQPVASNDTREGKQLNRRVEIVIRPKTVKKIEKSALAKESQGESYKEEELK